MYNTTLIIRKIFFDVKILWHILKYFMQWPHVHKIQNGRIKLIIIHNYLPRIQRWFNYFLNNICSNIFQKTQGEEVTSSNNCFANKFILNLLLILLLLVQQNKIHNVLSTFLPILSIYFIIVPCFELLHVPVYRFHVKKIYFTQNSYNKNQVQITWSSHQGSR